MLVWHFPVVDHNIADLHRNMFLNWDVLRESSFFYFEENLGLFLSGNFQEAATPHFPVIQEN